MKRIKFCKQVRSNNVEVINFSFFIQSYRAKIHMYSNTGRSKFVSNFIMYKLYYSVGFAWFHSLDPSRKNTSYCASNVWYQLRNGLLGTWSTIRLTKNVSRPRSNRCASIKARRSRLVWRAAYDRGIIQVLSKKYDGCKVTWEPTLLCQTQSLWLMANKR